MSDNEIRQILARRKKQHRRTMKREELIEGVQDVVAWVSLFGICFMLSIIG